MSTYRHKFSILQKQANFVTFRSLEACLAVGHACVISNHEQIFNIVFIFKILLKNIFKTFFSSNIKAGNVLYFMKMNSLMYACPFCVAAQEY